LRRVKQGERLVVTQRGKPVAVISSVILRAHDAVHLASAKTFQEKIEEQIAFASGDGRLEAAAKREGLQLIQKV
jgi:prevent-host-death family protein